MDASFEEDPIKFVVLYTQNELWKKAGHQENGVPNFSGFQQLMYLQMDSLQTFSSVNSYHRLVWYNFERYWISSSGGLEDQLPEMRAHWFETLNRINRGSWIRRNGGDWTILVGGTALIVALWMAFS